MPESGRTACVLALAALLYAPFIFLGLGDDSDGFGHHRADGA
jgi:hypothetical protein